jgi:hypothetical protein
MQSAGVSRRNARVYEASGGIMERTVSVRGSSRGPSTR